MFPAASWHQIAKSSSSKPLAERTPPAAPRESVAFLPDHQAGSTKPTSDQPSRTTETVSCGTPLSSLVNTKFVPVVSVREMANVEPSNVTVATRPVAMSSA